MHQSQLEPADNKFHRGNGEDKKHYWLTPPALYKQLSLEFGPFDTDVSPHPKPPLFDGLTAEWGRMNYGNIPFGSVVHWPPTGCPHESDPSDPMFCLHCRLKGKKKGPTAWVRKALAEHAKGKGFVLLYPVDKWLLMLLAAGAQVRNLGDVRWLATEDGSEGKGTGRHIAAFILGAPSTTAEKK